MGWGRLPCPGWRSLCSRVTHTLGIVPVGGGRPSFPSPWQPNQTNNTAGAGPGAGWQPVQPCFPLACPGNTRAQEGELRAPEALLPPLPWVAVGVGTLTVGSCCRVSLLPGSPQDRHKPLTTPTKTPHSTTGAFPTPTNHKPASSSPCPSARRSSFHDAPSLFLFPCPGPGIHCPLIPVLDATLGTATLQPPQPRAGHLVPEVMTQALAPGGNGLAGG